MFNMRNNSPFGGRGNRGFGYNYSPYANQAMNYPYEGVNAGGLVAKVMVLLAFSFAFALLGTFAGFVVFSTVVSAGTYFAVAIAGFVVLLILRFAINVSGLNLFLLYLFTFLEGMSLAPLLRSYMESAGNILGEAFLITALTSVGLAIYAWTTKRDFSKLADYLFIGLIILVVASIVGIFFNGLFTTGVSGLIFSVFGVVIFSGFMIYHIQQARYLPDTMPNAIGLTVSLFLNVINLFLFILRILSILQGGNRRR